ncbi:hypothetical protein GH733_004850 [Mirounga leonina]|nr:hypothetical protein GH733_004850 [Mirounga leonina]
MERIQRLLKKRRSEYKCACDASSNRLCYVQRLLTVRWSNDGRHSMNGSNSYHSNEDDDDGGGGDNENENDHDALGLPTIRTPPNIYRVFVDVVNGEYVPCKLILKSRSRENSVCSDTSDDRRSVSCEEATCSDTSESILEEEQEENHHKKLLSLSGTPEAFFWNRSRKTISIALLNTTPNPGSSCATDHSRTKRSSVRGIRKNYKEGFKVQSCQIAAEKLGPA